MPYTGFAVNRRSRKEQERKSRRPRPIIVPSWWGSKTGFLVEEKAAITIGPLFCPNLLHMHPLIRRRAKIANNQEGIVVGVAAAVNGG